MSLLIRGSLVCALVVGSVAAGGAVARAGDTFTGRVDVAFSDANVCAPEDGPIAWTGWVQVVRREREGGFDVHNNWHMQGTSASGTRYVATRIIEVRSATGSFSYSSRTRWLGQGPSDNTHITFTAQFPPGDFSFETDCRG